MTTSTNTPANIPPATKSETYKGTSRKANTLKDEYKLLIGVICYIALITIIAASFIIIK